MKLFFSILLFSFSSWGAPQKIISLSPAITEMIYALGFEKNLVGVSEHSDYPEAAKKIASVGPYSKPLLEKIMTLQPDLVFLPAEGPADIALQLKRLKINFKVLSIKKISQVGDAAQEIANEMQSPQVGEKFKAQWNKKTLETFKNSSATDKPSLIVLQTEPIIVASQNTFLDEILNRCGGKNIFSNKSGYPRVPLESVLSKKPRHILLVEHFESDTEKSKALEFWNKLGPTSLIDPSTATRPGPRILEGASAICKTINSR